MEFLTNAWRRVFSEDTQTTRTTCNGELLPFAAFAASRLLRIPPGTVNKGPFYAAMFEIAKNYIDADVKGISSCITRYRMSTLLNDIAETSSLYPLDLELLKDLMLLLERLLLEYLSENWDMVEDVLRVNKEAELPKIHSYGQLNRSRNSSSQLLQEKERARRNWQRAYRAAIKKIVQERFGFKRTAITMQQVFTEYSRVASQGEIRDSSTRTRAPILLLLGGGMAAGKSTVREIIGSDEIWSKVGKDAVVVEADAIKNQDIVFHALQQRLGDDPSISQLVHEYSTSTAEALLVCAINEQKDIVFDGTMTWLPFVEQTVAMARDPDHSYKRGPGYYQDENGRVHEEYWVIDRNASIEPGSKIPYRVELVGVTCDPGTYIPIYRPPIHYSRPYVALAVARGIWRKIRTGRGVPVASQLRSHRLFSQNFEAIAKMVDSATLYHTGSKLTTFTHSNSDMLSPKVICHSSSVTRGDLLVNPTAMEEFLKIRHLNDAATSVGTLYTRNHQQGGGRDGRVLERTLTTSIHSSSMGSLRHMLVEANKVASNEDWPNHVGGP